MQVILDIKQRGEETVFVSVTLRPTQSVPRTCSTFPGQPCNVFSFSSSIYFIFELELPKFFLTTLENILGLKNVKFLDLVASLVLTHVSNLGAHRLTKIQALSLEVACMLHSYWLM